jgi:hypothetical protein
MESVAGEHLRPERFGGLDPKRSLACLDGPDSYRIEDPSSPAEGVREWPWKRGEVVERWDAEEAELGPWGGGEDRIEEPPEFAAEAGRAVPVLEVVDADRDEHEVSLDEGFGRDQTHRHPRRGTGHGAGLPVHRRAVAVGEPDAELTRDRRPVVPDGIAGRDTVPERDDPHPAIAGADASRDAVSISEAGKGAAESVSLHGHERQT